MSAKRVLIVHGNGKQSGLCRHLVERTIARIEERGDEWRMHDLLADGFDPVLRMREDQATAVAATAEEDPLLHRYQQDILWADCFVIVQPVWWFGPPAILKGWVDRVLVDGIALTHATEPPEGLLGGKSALLVQTFKAPQIVDRLLMRRISANFWSKVVFFSIGISEVSALALYDVRELPQKRLDRFLRKLQRSLDKTVDRAVSSPDRTG